MIIEFHMKLMRITIQETNLIDSRNYEIIRAVQLYNQRSPVHQTFDKLERYAFHWLPNHNRAFQYGMGTV